MEVTNNSRAPQGIHTLDGVTYVKPGETKTVRINESLARIAKALDFFDLEGEPEDDDLGQPDARQSVYVPTDQMEELKSKFEEQTAEIGRLTSENGDLTSRVSERDSRIVTLESQVSELTAQLQAAPKVTEPAGAFIVKETSPGWFGVFGEDEKQIGKNMRENDAKAFEAMSPEDQKAYLAD
jgi:hypothetical protein